VLLAHFGVLAVVGRPCGSLAHASTLGRPTDTGIRRRWGFWDSVDERSLVDETAACPSVDVHDSSSTGTSLSSCAVTTSRFFFAVPIWVIASSTEYEEAL
jgi:hypothetical protein